MPCAGRPGQIRQGGGPQVMGCRYATDVARPRRRTGPYLRRLHYDLAEGAQELRPRGVTERVSRHGSQGGEAVGGHKHLPSQRLQVDPGAPQPARHPLHDAPLPDLRGVQPAALRQPARPGSGGVKASYQITNAGRLFLDRLAEEAGQS